MYPLIRIVALSKAASVVLVLRPSPASTTLEVHDRPANTDEENEGRPAGRLLAGESFIVDLTHAACPGVSGRDKFQAPDMASCAALCEADPGCDLWLYCPYLYDINSCLLHDQVSWSLGNWTRCYVSNATSSREMCIPDKYSKWKGAARTGSTRVPAKTAPTRAKRGFSGYLYAMDGGNEIRPCNDAAFLNREDGWCKFQKALIPPGPTEKPKTTFLSLPFHNRLDLDYTWMIRTVSDFRTLLFRQQGTCCNAHFPPLPLLL